MTDRFGPYELRGELGRGAMAIVWRGYDPNLDREVAIKEPTVPPGTPPATAIELAERFVREGRTAAALNHPGIVTVFAADSFDGRTAIVMELIEGETLASILERGPLPASAALSVLSQLLDAVAYAHERGVVHRDIKPDNVFLTTDGRVKLADFGIAHVGGTSALTQAGTIMGTPGYMAPEQVTGAPVDARADVFAIGAVAHEMLTGSNPFGATDGAAPTTVLYRIVHEPAPALPPQIDASLPPGLVAILGHAMAKDPAQRFRDARAFRAELDSGVNTVGQFTGPVSPSPHWAGAVSALGSPSPSRRWLPYTVVGAAGALVLVAMLWFALTPSTSPRAGMIAAQPAPAAVQQQGGAAPAATPAPDEASTAANSEQEVRGALYQWVATVNNRDLQGHLDSYASTVDPWFVYSNVDRSFIEGKFAPAYAKYSSMSLTVSDVSVNLDTPDSATVTFRKAWDFVGSKHYTGTEHDRIVFRRIGGTWRIVSETDIP